MAIEKTILKLFILLVMFFGLGACGGSSSGGGDDDGSNTPTLPANATKITTINASDIAEDAISSLELVSNLALRNVTEEASRPGDVLKLIIDMAFDKPHRSIGVANRTETEPCDSGSVTIDFEETATSFTGTLTFSSCRIDDVTLNDKFSFSSTFNDSGAYSDSGSGNISASVGSESFTLVVNFSETGNEFDGSFSTTTSYSISGRPDFNYLVTTVVPISGIDPNVSAGQIKVLGADNSSLLITVVGDNFLQVELDENGDGNYVFHENTFL
jgi:hypothetical protein